MNLVWTEWTAGAAGGTEDIGNGQLVDATKLSPYVDWYMRHEIPDAAKGLFDVRPQLDLLKAVGNDLPWLVLPAKALPPGAIEISAEKPGPLNKAQFPATPRPGDVIVGVIDAGLALSHARFRRQGGQGTRILSYWQQGGVWNDQPYLPFGRCLRQAELDDMMAQSGGDEAAFNQLAGLVDFADPSGERWVETKAPHGTFVADLAAGADPMDRTVAGFRDRTHLIMVDLAPRVSIGPSGSFLEFYVIWAIRHIVETADALWATFGDDTAKGFPVVINLSYGLHAGPKDGSMMVQKEIRAIQRARQADGLPPLHIILPAGNDNLEQGTAVLTLTDKPEAQAWRIVPEDRTSSYAEVWTDVIATDVAAADSHPFAIALSPPGGVTVPALAGTVGHFCDLVDRDGADAKQPLARIYCRRSTDRDGSEGKNNEIKHRFVYVICVAPTWSATRSAAPAGQWQITLQKINEGPSETALLYVQSDQNTLPGASTGLLSYFESPDYQRYADDGRLRDTYWKDPATGVISDSDSSGPVRRSNTLNAIAGSDGSLTVAGYRASDGWPADYSASARGNPRGDPGFETGPLNKGGHAFVDLAAVSDDGIWRLGRLAAGAHSGSAVVMQGTSFATAEVTRIVVERVLEGQDLAVLDEAALHYDPAQNLKLKLGGGRLGRHDQGRVAR